VRGPIDEKTYHSIKPMPKDGSPFQNFPGVYCRRCGETFALYSYSAYQPDGVDGNDKPYYDSCFKCGTSVSPDSEDV